MKKIFQAIALAAVVATPLALPATAQVDDRMMSNMGANMLLAGLKNSLDGLGVDTTNINEITLAQAVELSQQLNSSDTNDQTMKLNAETILDQYN